MGMRRRGGESKENLIEGGAGGEGVEVGRLVEEGVEREVGVVLLRRRGGLEAHLRLHLVADLLHLDHSHSPGAREGRDRQLKTLPEQRRAKEGKRETSGRGRGEAPHLLTGRRCSDGALMIDPTTEIAMQEEERRGLLWGVQLLKKFVNDIFNTRFGWRAGMKRLEGFTLEFDFLA
uniref:Uncharacterized protein n=1 Tax=Oryza meridionalis TaxID=40149 RepID=A0A0E0F9D1_9ORYZ